MTLTLNQSSSLRPLGEEHLRMFRRMTQGRAVVPRIAIPSEATMVRLSDSLVPYKEAEGTARKLGGRLATIMEALEDAQTMKYIGKAKVYVDWRRGVPQNDGHHRINRAEGKLEPLSSTFEAPRLSWHEKIYIYENALYAIQDNRPLVLYGFVRRGTERLDVDAPEEDEVVRVAYVEEK